MNATVAFVAGGGLAAISGFFGAIINARIGLLKGQAEVKHSDANTAQIFEDLAESWATRIDAKNQLLELKMHSVIAIFDNFVDAIGRACDRLEAIAPEEIRPVVLEIRDTKREAQRELRLALRKRSA